MNSYSTNGHFTPRQYHVFPSISDKKPGSPNIKLGLMPASCLMPASSPIPLQWGMALYAQGHTLDALWDFLESVSLEPKDPLGHYLCGLAFKALGLGEEAWAEWETVLSLTSGDNLLHGEIIPRVEAQWARSMAQRLLGRESLADEEFPCRQLRGPKPPLRELSVRELSVRELSAIDDILDVRAENRCGGTGSQEDLEQAILDAVQRHGDCGVNDQFIADQLKVTTEEQVIGWKQSFSARERLDCRPYQVTLSRDMPQEGVIFKRCPL